MTAHMVSVMIFLSLSALLAMGQGETDSTCGCNCEKLSTKVDELTEDKKLTRKELHEVEKKQSDAMQELKNCTKNRKDVPKVRNETERCNKELEAIQKKQQNQNETLTNLTKRLSNLTKSYKELIKNYTDLQSEPKKAAGPSEESRHDKTTTKKPDTGKECMVNKTQLEKAKNDTENCQQDLKKKEQEFDLERKNFEEIQTNNSHLIKDKEMLRKELHEAKKIHSGTMQENDELKNELRRVKQDLHDLKVHNNTANTSLEPVQNDPTTVEVTMSVTTGQSVPENSGKSKKENKSGNTDTGKTKQENMSSEKTKKEKEATGQQNTADAFPKKKTDNFLLYAFLAAFSIFVIIIVVYFRKEVSGYAKKCFKGDEKGRPTSKNYRKLDSNVEESMEVSHRVKDYIY